MKSLIFLITLSISLNSSAGWVLAKEQYAYKASKKDGLRKIMRIANNLMATGLNKENFTSFRPIELVRAEIKSQIFRWENDENCRVNDPRRVPLQIKQYFKAIYKYFPKKSKYELSGYEVIPAFKVPCDRSKIQIHYHFRYFSPLEKVVRNVRRI